MKSGVKVKVFRRDYALGKAYKVLLQALSRTCIENSYNRISPNRFMCLTHPHCQNELQRAQDPHTRPLRTNTGIQQSQNSRALGSRYDAQVDGQSGRDGPPALLETRTLESDPPSRQVPIRSNRTRSCSKRVVAEEWMSSLWTRGQSLSSPVSES